MNGIIRAFAKALFKARANESFCNGILFFVLLAGTFVPLAQTQAIDYRRFPDGLPAARENSAIGVLGSAFREPRSIYYQAVLEQLKSKAYGLSHLADLDEIKQAEKIYYLEALTVGVLEKLLNDQSIKSDFERTALLYEATRVYRDIRQHAERLYEIMIREIDRAKPGTSGIQLPTETSRGVRYAPNYRMERELTIEEQRILYQQKQAEYRAAGGDLSSVKTLSRQTIKELPQISVVEFVEFANGTVLFTDGNAGHILMARGRKVATAGTMLLLKDNTGKVRLAVVSNSSGSFKPDLVSVDEFGHRLIEKLGLGVEELVITKGEPLSPQVVKILMKSRNEDPALIKEKITAIKNSGTRARTEPEAIMRPKVAAARACFSLFMN